MGNSKKVAVARKPRTSAKAGQTTKAVAPIAPIAPVAPVAPVAAGTPHVRAYPVCPEGMACHGQHGVETPFEASVAWLKTPKALGLTPTAAIPRSTSTVALLPKQPNMPALYANAYSVLAKGFAALGIEAGTPVALPVLLAACEPFACSRGAASSMRRATRAWGLAWV